MLAEASFLLQPGPRVGSASQLGRECLKKFSGRWREREVNVNTASTDDVRRSFYGSKPKTATLAGVPTYTLPLATTGVMNLLSRNWSRPFGA